MPATAPLSPSPPPVLSPAPAYTSLATTRVAEEAGRAYWAVSGQSPGRELAEVVLLLGAVSVAGWFTPLSYHALGHIYLLTVIVLSLRVSRWPALVAAVVSALVWDYVFIPPRLSFSVLDFDESLLLGTYFVVALTAGQLTTRIREQQRTDTRRERRATALFNLTRALAASQTLDAGVTAALRQADDLFEARSALLLASEGSKLTAHPAGSLVLAERSLGVAAWVWRNRHEAGRFTAVSPDARELHLPLLRAGRVLGVLVVEPPDHASQPTADQRNLLETFAAQIALLIEREQLRGAHERAKLAAESDRLHRTLLDSVSHELRTPLAVLQAAAEQLDRSHAENLAGLPAEILTAARRLNRVVANLLSQSRLESGGVRPRLDWCDARDLIAAARRELGEALAGRAILLDLPPDMPLLRVDSALMEHVITNILLNAALYSPPGGSLSISASWAPGLGRVSLTFSDEGPGIPEDVRAQLFQPSRRGEPRPGGGLGLGLSIVRGLVQAQGGDIAVGNGAGPGPRLTIHLPLVQHSVVPQE